MHRAMRVPTAVSSLTEVRVERLLSLRRITVSASSLKLTQTEEEEEPMALAFRGSW
jgi:hypothetical protein